MLAPPGRSAPPPTWNPVSAPDYFNLTWFLAKLFFDSFDDVMGMTRNKISLLMLLKVAEFPKLALIHGILLSLLI